MLIKTRVCWAHCRGGCQLPQICLSCREHLCLETHAFRSGPRPIINWNGSLKRLIFSAQSSWGGWPKFWGLSFLLYLVLVFTPLIYMCWCLLNILYAKLHLSFCFLSISHGLHLPTTCSGFQNLMCCALSWSQVFEHTVWSASSLWKLIFFRIEFICYILWTAFLGPFQA